MTYLPLHVLRSYGWSPRHVALGRYPVAAIHATPCAVRCMNVATGSSPVEAVCTGTGPTLFLEHLCQTQVPGTPAIRAGPNLVHVCDEPEFHSRVRQSHVTTVGTGNAETAASGATNSTSGAFVACTARAGEA